MSSPAIQRTLAVLVAAPVVLGLAGLTATAQAPDGRWVRLAPYPQPTQEIGGAVANGKLYILGAYGANAPGGLAGWFNEYDPATDRWTKKRDIPMPVHHQAMVGYNGKVYVFGGGIKPRRRVTTGSRRTGRGNTHPRRTRGARSRPCRRNAAAGLLPNWAGRFM